MRFRLIFFFLLFFCHVDAQFLKQEQQIAKAEEWADSILVELDEKEKLGQLFMPRAFSQKDAKHVKYIKKLIKENKIGGLCFFQGSPAYQAKLINEYQALSDIPLMVAIDAEWGLGMRFKENAISFPMQLELGSIQNEQLLYQMGQTIAKQCQRIGVNINFAPVVDVNNNPSNPVINTRSFGEDKYNVASKSRAYILGMEDAGVLSCAKHFPGHGDTDVDSHYDLPIINHDMDRIEDIELMPFRALKDEVGSMMVAHVHMPAIDDRPNRPTTLSHNAVTGILKKGMGYKGLVMTDALDMKGVTKHFAKGEAEAEALLAGNDLLLLSEDIPMAIAAILNYVEEDKITWKQINESVKKILVFKYLLNLTTTPKIKDIDGIDKEINNAEAIVLKERLIEEALTLVKNDQNIIPIKDGQHQKFASLSIGANKETDFQKRLSSFEEFTHFQCPKSLSNGVIDARVKALSKYDIVFVSTHDMSSYEKNDFGVTKAEFTLIRKLSENTKVVLTVFGSPYALKYFEKAPNILLAHSEDPINQDKAAQALFGVFDIKGKLPVGAGNSLKAGMGIYSSGLNRLGYSSPERVGMNSDSLKYIDEIVAEMISRKASPGCQILCAKDGMIIYDKCFGYHTYDKKRKVQASDKYDLASITKILASTLSIMKLEDEGLITLNTPIVDYISVLDTCNKKDLILEDILAHHAGLRGWVPFYEQTIEPKTYYKKKRKGKKRPKTWRPNPAYYRTVRSDSFSVKVLEDLFMRTDYVDSIYSRIYATSLKEDRDYKYSDLGFYLIHQIIKNRSNKPLDEYAQEQFYGPLGLKNTLFNPREKFELASIVPTEEDKYFRNRKVHGHVHDMGSAMLGGVAGHAGLFSTTNDLVVLMQMLLNGGRYGGRKYLDPETINYFTTRHYRSTRRALGFDMKQLDPDERMNMSEAASDQAFGHLGFTGTSIFSDPKENLTFIFLSNRTYPTMENKVFGRKNYRPRIQSVFYKALGYDVSIEDK